jgi:hypothetical protein
MLDVKERNKQRNKSDRISFLRTVAGYTMTDRKCHDDIPEELGITYIINEVIKRLLKQIA